MSTGVDGRDEYAAARRAVARRLHPDRGGDPQEYLAAMAVLDRQYRDRRYLDDMQHAADNVVQVVTRRRVRAAVGVSARRGVVLVRGALPRRWPGARRYGRL